MTTPPQSERGAALLIVAGALIFLFGMAALAVDSSDFYQTARVGQTTADLACLAGVAEIGDGAGPAIEMAHAYAVANWPGMAGASLPSHGNPRTVTDGNGNVVTYLAEPNVGHGRMHVTVTERNPTTFGRVLGTNSVDVVQAASCERNKTESGGGVLPMAALPGTFNGRLHDCAAKVTGNCGNLDSGSGAKDWGGAIADGMDQQLQKHHGHRNSSDPDTGNRVINCPDSGVCSAGDTETGNMVGKFRSGLDTRLKRIGGADCVADGSFNCDKIHHVFGTTPQTLTAAFGASAPSWWESSLYGPYNSVRDTQYYFNGNIPKCDSPRFATVPIVAQDLDWDIGSAAGTWPNGKKTMKIVGFYIVYIREPDTAGEVGSGPVIADVVHVGPNATCGGAPFNPYQTGVTIETVRLVKS